MKTEKGKGYICGAQLFESSICTIQEVMSKCASLEDHGLYEVTYKRIKIPKGKKK